MAHLFIHCPFAAQIWDSLLARFGRVWVMLAESALLMDEWYQTFTGDLSLQGKVIWDCVPHIVCWVL